MKTENIVLLVSVGLIAAFLAFLFVYAASRRRPATENGTAAPTPVKKAWRWAFGTRHAEHFSDPEEALYHTPHRWVMDVVFVMVLVAALLYMGIDLHLPEKFQVYPVWKDISFNLNEVVHPDWDYFWGVNFYHWDEGVVYQVFQTFGIAYLATLAAAVIALPFGLLASHKLFGRYAWFSEIFLIAVRTFPELLLAILMVAFSGINPITGIVALGLHSIGMIGKLYAEEIDEINMEPLEALTAGGATTWQRIHLGIMPQFTPSLFSVALYRFDINIRTATILGVVVGADCGIGYSIFVMSYGQHWNLLGSCIIGVVILIIIIDLFSSWLRKKLV
jgi:phosphonate transport system permease protein